MPKIFISYRRNDSATSAGRIYDRLEGRFGQGQVFMDVDTIRPGVNFVEAVEQAVGICDGLVAVIGSEWLKASDATGARRLEDPADLVRLEIATALERDIRVIPVLVQGAEMPRETDLPEDLKGLAHRNALEVSDNRFRSDVEQLIEALDAPITEPLADSVFVEPVQLSGSGFVGRDREMEELNRALDETLAGHGRLVMLAGEPGIGKTRLAQELASRAESRDALVLWGRWYEEQGAPPFWPWVQLLTTLTHQVDPEQLATELGSGATDLAEIIPELRDQLPDLRPPATLEPEQARFRLFQSITTWLSKRAQSQTLLLVLDDLHWADQPSLLLLQFLARQMEESHILVVGTYRDVELSRQHPLSETLAQLSRQPVFRRELLRGLGQETTRQFIQAASGIEPQQGLVDTIYAHTEGNPFFMSEVVQLLSERGELTAGPLESEGLKIPEGVREVIGQRLNRLSDLCNQALSTASVIGREFDFRLLLALSDGIIEEHLLDAIDEAVGANLIEEVPGARERYQFSHSLIQQTLVGEWTTSRRVRLHARIGTALEEMFGEQAEAHAAELAYHFAEADTVLGPEKLSYYSLTAGNQALSAYAWEEAVPHLSRALTAKGINAESTETEQPLDGESAAILFALGQAQVALNLSDKAVSSLHRSFDYYAQAGDVSRVLEIAEYGHSLHVVYGMRDVMPRALELVEPDSHEAGRVLANYGFALGQEGEYDKALEMFDRALAISRREADKALEARTLANLGNVHGFYLRWKECQEANSQAIELTADIEEPQHRHRSLLWNSYAQTSLGRPEQAAIRAAEGLELAERFNDRMWFPRCLRALLIPYIAKGDWLSAEQICERFPSGASIPYKIYMDYQRGLSHSAAELQSLQESAKTIDGRVELLILGIIAHVSGGAELIDMAESSALLFKSLRSLRLLPTSNSCLAGCLGFAAAYRQDVNAAKDLYPTLVSLPGQWFWLCSSDRLRGLLVRILGDLDKANNHFEEGLAFCRQAGYRPELAWTCCDYADTLLQRNDPGDREKAMSLLDESLAISTELGMRPLMERVLSRQDGL